MHFSWISNCILFCDKKTFLNQLKLFWWLLNSGRSRGRGVQWQVMLVETLILACVQTPPHSYIDRMVYHFLTGWFFIETGVAFCLSLNFRDIPKRNCFWVPSHDPFASAHKAEFKYTVRGQRYKLIMCNRDWWEGGVGKKLFNPKIKMFKSTFWIPGSAPA